MVKTTHLRLAVRVLEDTAFSFLFFFFRSIFWTKLKAQLLVIKIKGELLLLLRDRKSIHETLVWARPLLIDAVFS